MISFLRIISLILFIGLVLTIGVALFIGSGTPGGLPAGNETFLAAVLVLALFVAPALAAYGWIVFRSREADALVREARASLSSAEKGIETWRYRGLLGEIARLLEESRQLILVQRRGLAERDLFRARILEGIGEGVLAIDRRKTIVLANARALEMLGAREIPPGTPLYGLVREATIIASFERALAGEPASELVTLGSGAAERQIDLQILPFEGETDIAAVALLVDVTRLAKLERARRQFLADFSHEVRTPLAGLRSAAETLERGGLPAADEAHLRRIVGRQLDRLERLVEDLSELNRIESGALVLQKRPTNLGELLSDVADDFRGAAAARGVVLDVEGEGEAEVDPQRVQQIVANLVDNAIKFTPSGSRVRLAIRRKGDTMEIAVADEGEGIPEDDRERVFNRFYRVDKSRSQSVPGTGLGLAIAKHLTVLHGGRIEVDSSSLRGATFRVLLPLR